MTAKKPSAKASTKPLTIIGCTFNNKSEANKHTRAAIESIANAAAKNAEALKAAADALSRCHAANQVALKIEQA